MNTSTTAMNIDMPVNVTEDWFKYLVGVIVAGVSWVIRRLFSLNGDLQKELRDHIKDNTRSHGEMWEAHHAAVKETAQNMVNKDDLREMERRIMEAIKDRIGK